MEDETVGVALGEAGVVEDDGEAAAAELAGAFDAFSKVEVGVGELGTAAGLGVGASLAVVELVAVVAAALVGVGLG